MKKLGSEIINGIEFFFNYSPGDGVVVTAFGYLHEVPSDYVGLFNNLEEAKCNLKKSHISKFENDTFLISNLKSINEEAVYNGV